MKNKFTIFTLVWALFLSLTACDKDETTNLPSTGNTGKYIINYGSYSGAKSTISLFDTENDTIINDYYETVNNFTLISNIQYAYNFNNKIFFMGNNSDQVFYVDNSSFEQTKNGIAKDIVKPRYCVGAGNYLYVSCWGGDIWTDSSLSYIAKIDITKDSVVSKIKLVGGPEGLAIANGKLYAALNYDKKVAVMDLSTEKFTYIETPAVTTYFIKDKSDNLYVSLVSSYSKPSTETGLGYLNTTTDKLDAVYKLDGISSSYVNIMSANNRFSKIYVMTSAYDVNWNLSGAIAVFDVTTKAFETNMFVEGVSALNGVAIDSDNVFCFISEGVTGNGLAKKYTTDGTFVKDYETGIAPFMLLTNE